MIPWHLARVSNFRASKLKILGAAALWTVATIGLPPSPTYAEQDPCAPILAHGVPCESHRVELFSTVIRGVLHVRSTSVPLPPDLATVGCCVSDDAPLRSLFLVRAMKPRETIEPEQPTKDALGCTAPLIGSRRDIASMIADGEDSEVLSLVGRDNGVLPLLEVRGLAPTDGTTPSPATDLCGFNSDSPAWHSPAPAAVPQGNDRAVTQWRRAGHAYVLYVRPREGRPE